MAQSINGLYKAEVIGCKRWKTRSAVVLAPLTWVDGYNSRSLLERLGHIPPTEAEAAYYAAIGTEIWQPEFPDLTLSRKTGVVSV